jgi:hypothetical protein
MNSINTDLKHALSAKFPLIYLLTEEEERVIKAINGSVPEGYRLLMWRCTQGIVSSEDGIVENTSCPVKALEYVQEHVANNFYVFLDLPEFFQDPSVLRSLKDYSQAAKKDGRGELFIISTQLNIPESIRSCVHVIDVALPGVEELSELSSSVLSKYAKIEVSDSIIRELALSLSGLSLNESYHVLMEMVAKGHLSRQGLQDEIRLAKKTSIIGSDFLEFVPQKHGIEQVAGLGNFKKWMNDRARLFNQQSLESEMPIPRGILITGVSGCGKSLCAKAISKVWGVPLFRLDMNLVFSGLHGNPQGTFHKALKTIEAMAPAVLWIDEIENGLGSQDIHNSVQSHIFSAFLTWMQEKPPLVFVAATANRIEYLPAEMIRKGRFDQVFFVDLPNDEDRAEMISLYLDKHQADASTFDIRLIVAQTDGWNGAEIEQAIESACIQALADNRMFTTKDVLDHAQNIVPLSQTMSEQIKELRDWAWDRAIFASSKSSMVLNFDEI